MESGGMMETRPARVTKWLPGALRRERAAAYIYFSAAHFDKPEDQGVMPKARLIGTSKVWLRHELDWALRDLPKVGESERNTCDAPFEM